MVAPQPLLKKFINLNIKLLVVDKKIKTTIKVLIALLVTIFLVKFLLSQIKNIEIFHALKGIPFVIILLGFLFYASSYFFRALRFKILLDSKISLGKLFSIVSVHTMAIGILPVRAGELSYVYLLKREKQKGTEALSNLITARLFDFIVISVLFFLAVVFAKNLPDFVSNAFLSIAIFLFLLIFTATILLFYNRKLLDFFRRLEKTKLGKKNIFKFIFLKAKETFDSLSLFKKRRILPKIILTTILIWIFQYLTLYIIIIGMGIKVSLPYAVIVGSFSIFGSVIPSLGGFGTIEGFWALALVSLGLSAEQAISTGFAQHIVMIAYFLILGIYGLLRIKKQ